MSDQIELSGVNKYYGAYHALRNIDLKIRKGSFTALVGPSGCGKSTLLRSLAGLESISTGTLAIAGQVMNTVPPRKRDIAMVFQSYALYPHMTVEENLTYSLRIRGTPKAEAKRAAAEVAATTGLSPLLGRYPRELSGGQRQRVAMSRAIIRNPKAFLFDEPLSNLDAALRVHMRKEIRALHDRLGATSVYVTHDQIEAMTMADHVVVMCAGVIEQQGQTVALGYGVTPGAAMTAGLRPEHISIAAPATGRLKVAVATVESTGSATYVTTATSSELVLVVNGRAEISVGDEIGLDFAPAQLHLFDTRTERRLEAIDHAAGNG